MSYVLGLDLGTSALKGLLISRDGKAVASASSEYPVLNPAPGFSEQNPLLWPVAAENVIKEIIRLVPDAKAQIEAVSFSGQMHTLVLLDENNKPLRNAILWNDVRTTAQCEKITKVLGADLLKITKNRALEGFTLPKILWVQENELGIWKKTKKFLLPKDFLSFYFTGEMQMEYSDSAGTLMLDIEKKQWSKRIADAFNIPQNVFPKLMNSTDKAGVIKKEIAQKLGLTNQPAVYPGGADNACAAAGAGVLDTKTGMCSIGTSGVFLAYEGRTVQDYKGSVHFFNHIIKDSYYSMGVTLSAGSSLSWFKNAFAKNMSFEEFLDGVEKIPAGSGGLLFTPYLVGERTPYADSAVRGSFIGIDISHTTAHFARAVMEGITFSLKDCMELMIKAGKKFERVIAVGGGAKNKDWLQMQADIFNCKIITLETEQGPSLGACMTAAVGAGWFDSFQNCAEKFVKLSKEYAPDARTAQEYKTVYEKYKKIYAATRELTK
ncbi:MAG: xylulokinase [Elusimicrobia bacterium]|nr:xylulokinase [Elusimicrobiota bacterium]